MWDETVWAVIAHHAWSGQQIIAFYTDRDEALACMRAQPTRYRHVPDAHDDASRWVPVYSGDTTTDYTFVTLTYSINPVKWNPPIAAIPPFNILKI